MQAANAAHIGCRKAADDGLVFNETHIDRNLAFANRRPGLQRTPDVSVAVVSVGQQRHHLALVVFRTLGQSESRYEFGENAVPVLAHDVAIGGPVFDDIPEAIQAEKLKAGIGELQDWVPRLVVELKIANLRVLRDIELFVWQVVIANRLQGQAEGSERCLI